MTFTVSVSTLDSMKAIEGQLTLDARISVPVHRKQWQCTCPDCGTAVTMEGLTVGPHRDWAGGPCFMVGNDLGSYMLFRAMTAPEV